MSTQVIKPVQRKRRPCKRRRLRKMIINEDENQVKTCSPIKRQCTIRTKIELIPKKIIDIVEDSGDEFDFIEDDDNEIKIIEVTSIPVYKEPVYKRKRKEKSEKEVQDMIRATLLAVNNATGGSYFDWGKRKPDEEYSPSLATQKKYHQKIMNTINNL